jgi:2,4-dienoyl-CoA reductase-like NADH-dependent reductase (Old Yellow Enzyme family)
MADAFGHLLAPLDLGPVTLPNRIVSTAHQTNLIAEHLPTDDYIAYHEARARGGTGMIIQNIPIRNARETDVRDRCHKPGRISVSPSQRNFRLCRIRSGRNMIRLNRRRGIARQL